MDPHRKRVIFGAFDHNSRLSEELIFAEDWEHDQKGRKKCGYAQSLQHIRLIEKHGYTLEIFKQNYALGDPQTGTAKIIGIEKKLYKRKLSSHINNAGKKFWLAKALQT